MDYKTIAIIALLLLLVLSVQLNIRFRKQIYDLDGLYAIRRIDKMTIGKTEIKVTYCVPYCKCRERKDNQADAIKQQLIDCGYDTERFDAAKMRDRFRNLGLRNVRIEAV